jgi:hypothetical protein
MEEVADYEGKVITVASPQPEVKAAFALPSPS